MWKDRVIPKVTHKFFIVTALMTLALVITNGILMRLDILPSWCGWLNFPFVIYTIFFIPYGVEKWLNED